MHDIQFFEKPPRNFNAQVLIGGCYVEWQKKVLLLKRAPEKCSGNLWCLPGGEIENGETLLQGSLRELEEETGICLKSVETKLIGTVYLRTLPLCLDYSLSIYYGRMRQKPEVVLDTREHVDAKWLLIQTALQFPLIQGGISVLKYCFNEISSLGEANG